MSNRKSLPGTGSAISSPESAVGLGRYALQDGPIRARSGRVPAPASPSATPEMDAGRLIHGTCGPSTDASPDALRSS